MTRKSKKGHEPGRRGLFFGLLLVVSLAYPLSAATVSYTADTSDFANPERGWFPAFYYYGYQNSNNNVLNSANFQSALTSSSNYSGDMNVTLVKRIYDLGGIYGGPSYTNQPLDSNVLNDIATDLSTARSMGIKLIIRFDYNEGPISAADAPESIILNHISQITSLLQANEDVIAYIEAGFIGTWGEWHDSTNGLTDPANNNIVQGEIDVLTAELAALPTDRMIAVRYPGYTLEIFNTTTPITAANAFNGSNYSRCGTHDDCFEIDQYDGGTYAKGTNLNWTPAQFKSFLAQQNFSVQEGGESCGSSSYSGCANSLTDLQNEHWSALHDQYEQSVIQGWVSGGCINQIDLGLGYRYQLIQSTVPSTANQGAVIPISFQVTNNGFANCFNPRDLQIILRPTGQTGTGTAIPITESSAQNTDPRFWQPGQTYTVSLNVTLPAALGPGTYSVLLNLPDPKTTLSANPAYSIRLADLNGSTTLWESSTGYNELGQTLNIANCPSCTVTPSPTVTLTPTVTLSPTITLTPSITSTPSPGTIISVDFQGGSATNGTPPNMAPGEVAGVVAAANWNDADGTSGTLTNLLDNNADTTGANLSFTAGNGIWSIPITASPGNYDMMMGYIDSDGTGSASTTVQVSGLPTRITANSYSVYVYFAGDNGTATRIGDYTIGSTTLAGTDAANTSFSGTFTQAVGGGNGNYVLFTSQTASSFTLVAVPGASTDTYPRAPINGIQIVGNTSPIVTATPSPTFTNSPASSATLTNTSTNTSTNTATQTATNTSSNTATATSTNTATSSPTNTGTSSPTASYTNTNTYTPTVLYTFTNTLTNTVTLTLTNTPSPTHTPTNSPTGTSTNTPIYSFTPTNTWTITPTYTVTNTVTHTTTNFPTNTVTVTATGTATPTLTFLATSTNTNTVTKTFTLTSSMTATPSLTASASPTPTASATNTTTATLTFTKTITPTATPINIDTSTPTSSPVGTATPTSLPNPVIYPNPAGGTTVTIQLPGNNLTDVKVQIFTLSFREVQTVQVAQVAGNTLTVPLVDKSGVALANGLYYFFIHAGNQKWIEKVLVLR